MAHKTRVNGTNYEISGGKTLVNGTAYKIDKGKTLVGGTAYSISFGPPALANCTPAQIQQVAQSGQAPNYWAVGDKVGITLNGTVGELSLSGTYYAFIIGFNHNSIIEGNNSIHFQFGKTSAGVDIAFCDSLYDNYDTTSTNKFKMNTTKTNSGGWKSSTMRTARCAEFLTAMPTTWQNVITACTKYSDNTGGGSDTASYVTATSDKIWLLSEFEVQGTGSYANSAEQNYQKQYDYYKNGNSKVKYKHSATTTACKWWLRSVHAKTGSFFCFVYTGGSASRLSSYYSYGFAPGFKVG